METYNDSLVIGQAPEDYHFKGIYEDNIINIL